ncbi:NACHT domain-containing protein [Streptomyces virginiae]
MGEKASRERLNPFKRQLSEQLRARMKELGKSEPGLLVAAGIAGSPIGKGTLNQALNPAHPSVPSERTLAAICAVLDVEPTTPTFRRLAGLRERAQDHETLEPSPLHRYLEAVNALVPEHPYTPVSVGKRVPGLVDVYVRQQARRRLQGGTGGSPGETAVGAQIDDEPDVPIPADRVFLREEPVCVLLAPPGGGKSTLLRHQRAVSVGRLLHGSDVGVPVLVRAGALVGAPLRTVLAQAASAEVRRGMPLDDDLPDALFAGKPKDLVPWLVLVDGFDEISDGDSRRIVLETITTVVKRNAASYRFVVATRPLPESELEALGDDVPCFWLEPFTPTNLLHYAEKYFRSLDDPERHAAVFTAMLEPTRLAEPARTPLMAYMLCQLYLTDPDRFPPNGRSAVYEEFVTQLRRGDRAKDISDGQQQAVDALGRNGGLAAEQWAMAVIERLPQLIEHLAYVRIRQNESTAAVDVLPRLGDEAVACCPTGVSHGDRQAFLRELLRHSSLVVERPDGDFEFPHLTITEYLAARHATRNLASGSRVLDELPEILLQDGSPVDAERHDPSYIGFVLDRLFAPGSGLGGEASRILERSANGHTFRACLFIADQAQRGTLLPDPVVQATAHALRSIARIPEIDGSDRVRAAEALTWLSEDSGQMLAELISNTGLGEGARCQAAVALTRLDGQYAARALAGAMEDPSLRPSARMTMADELSGVVRNTGLSHFVRLRAADALDHFARTPDRQIADITRIRAAEALTLLDPVRAADVLGLLGRDACIAGVDRVRAAEALVVLEPAGGVRVLVLLAGDFGVGAFDRVRAAEAMLRVEPRRAAEALEALAVDDRLDSHGRVRAGEGLTRVDPQRAAKVLDMLVRDRGLDDSDRARAGEVLARLDPQRAVSALAYLAGKASIDGSCRLRAVEAMMDLAPDDGAAILTSLINDADISGSVRMLAVQVLTRLIRSRPLSRPARLSGIEALDHYVYGRGGRPGGALVRLLEQWDT